MSIRLTHMIKRSTVKWSLLTMLVWGCGTAEQETPLADRGTERSWLATIFSSRPDPIVDCVGLNAWLTTNDSAFVSKVERAGFIAELQYRPAACLACLEQRTASFMDEAFRSRVSELDMSELYVLRVSTIGDTSVDTLQLGLTESLVDDLVEVIGSDTLQCAFMHVEAMPSMLPYTSALIGFNRPQDSSHRRIILLDRSNGFGGDLVFQFSDLDIYRSILPDSLINGRS